MNQENPQYTREDRLEAARAAHTAVEFLGLVCDEYVRHSAEAAAAADAAKTAWRFLDVVGVTKADFDAIRRR